MSRLHFPSISRNSSFLRLFLVLLILSAATTQAAQQPNPTGHILGQILDARSGVPIVGANLQVIDNTQGASSDIDGRFTFRNLPAGIHALKITMLGYTPRIVTDLVVRPGRSDLVRITLEPTSQELQAITVRPQYFSGRTASGSVTQEFHREEIRRAAGSAEDVNRIMQALPSVGMGGMDERNDLIVRGGNPMENLFLLDGHPVHNINHFGSQGSTGGPIGMIHVDFIDNVHFSPGGFDSRFGDRLSSVMDVHFREGSREKMAGEAFMSMAGLGLEAEGPIDFDGSRYGSSEEGSTTKGSWLIGLRRSYLELIKEQIGYENAPVMSDFGGKFVYDLRPDLKLESILLSSWNRSLWTVEEDPDQNYNVDQTQYSICSGVSLKHILNAERINSFRLTMNHQDFDQQFSRWDDLNQIRNDAWERTLSFEASQLIIHDHHDLRIGLGAETASSQHDVSLKNIQNAYGGMDLDSTSFNLSHDQTRSWLFVQLHMHLTQKDELQFGLRVDHQDYLGTLDGQPRISWRHDFSEEWIFNAASGLYVQTLPVYWLVQSEKNDDLESMKSRHPQVGRPLPMYWLVQSEENDDLESMKSQHLQAGIEFSPRSDLLFSLDLFHRKYRDLPVSEYNPDIPLADVGSFYGYNNLGTLTSDGEGLSYGAEFFAQKKLKDGTYGSFAASWSLSRYRTSVGKWLPGPFDRRLRASLIMGWIPNSRWEFSLKWRAMSGSPYTPHDVAASAASGGDVYDHDRLYAERLPIYHRLDLRADRRIHGKRWDVVMYWDIQNAYDMKNEAYRYWKQGMEGGESGIKIWYGWRIMPVFGITVEF